MSTHAVSTSLASAGVLPPVGETLHIIAAAQKEIVKQRKEIAYIKENICQHIIDDIVEISQDIVSGKPDYKIGMREVELDTCMRTLVYHSAKILEAKNTVATQEGIIARAEAVRLLTIPAMQQVPKLHIFPPGILPLIVWYLE